MVIAPHEAAIDAFRSIGDDLPGVVVEGGLGAPTVPVVCIDQEEVGRLATGHLLGLATPPSTTWPDPRVAGGAGA